MDPSPTTSEGDRASASQLPDIDEQVGRPTAQAGRRRLQGGFPGCTDIATLMVHGTRQARISKASQLRNGDRGITLKVDCCFSATLEIDQSSRRLDALGY